MRGFLLPRSASPVRPPSPCPSPSPAARGDDRVPARPRDRRPGARQSAPAAPSRCPSRPSPPATAPSAAPAAEQGLPRRDVRHFSLVGVVWDDPDTELHGRVQVRTRAVRHRHLVRLAGRRDPQRRHAADPGTAERTSGRVRGATAPLWVGDSDGVEVRVRAEPTAGRGRPAAPVRRPRPLRSRRACAWNSSTRGGAPAPPAGSRAAGTATAPSHARTADRRGSRRDGRGRTAEPPRSPPPWTRPPPTPASPPLGATEIPALDRQQTEQRAVRPARGAS